LKGRNKELQRGKEKKNEERKGIADACCLTLSLLLLLLLLF
jgi:hypothetical protein